MPESFLLAYPNNFLTYIHLITAADFRYEFFIFLEQNTTTTTEQKGVPKTAA